MALGRGDATTAPLWLRPWLQLQFYLTFAKLNCSLRLVYVPGAVNIGEETPSGTVDGTVEQVYSTISCFIHISNKSIEYNRTKTNKWVSNLPIHPNNVLNRGGQRVHLSVHITKTLHALLYGIFFFTPLIYSKWWEVWRLFKLLSFYFIQYY